MVKQKKDKRKVRALFLSGLLCAATLWGLEAPAQAALKAETLIPVGHTVGIKLFAEGVVVIGLAEVETDQGTASPAQACGLRVGDVIGEADGKPVESSGQFAALLQRGETLELEVTRDGEELTVPVQPVRGKDGVYRLGAWIRDSMAGIGTVTFYDPATGVFGALGHGITDSDTGLLMPLAGGAAMDASVKAVKRGKTGEPGELKGSFDLTEDLGQLYANTEQGIFGILERGPLTDGQPLPVAKAEQIREGEAEILANVRGGQVERYGIRIVRVLEGAEGPDLLLEVTDPRLLEMTGGIVQGMSGSPIIQNGKLVGAVTHVLVNDPTRGYGIFIENMLTAAG